MTVGDPQGDTRSQSFDELLGASRKRCAELIGRSQVVAVMVLLATLPQYETVAEAAALDTVPVRFGMLFDGSDPVAGDVICQLERPCVLLDNMQPALRISIQFSRQDGYLSEQLDVRCGVAECSFATHKSSIITRDGREFDIFEGSESGVETSLVLRPLKRLGHLALAVGRRTP